MAFEPIQTIGRSVSSAMLRYSAKADHGVKRLYIMARPELIAMVSGSPKFWRLDIDRKAGRGRLTSLFQTDEHPATRKGTAESGGKSIRFSWAADPKTLEHFPGEGTKALEHTITSMGIEFDLPKK